MIEGLFFELLQVAIGTRRELSYRPSVSEWKEFFALSKKQALVAVAFVGVKILRNVNEDENLLNLPEMLYLQWLGLTAKVAQRNKEVSAACNELVSQYVHDGIQCCILKGQGNLEYYPEDLRECRTPGDIDVWCKTMDENGINIAVSDLDGKGAHYEKYHGKEAAIEYVKMLHRIVDTEPTEGVRYHHIDAPSVGGVEVEAHFRPLFLDSPLRNHRLQGWFQLNEQFGVHDAKIGDCVIPTPTVSFNAVYQLCHIYRHMFEEGIGLRQLLDYYFVLRALHIEQGSLADRTESMAQWAEGMGIAVASNTEIMHTLSRFGMKKFAGAVMWVLAMVYDRRVDVKTKTHSTSSGQAHKTPDGSVSNEESEIVCKHPSSASSSSTDSFAAPYQPSGNKQEINHSLVVSDWKYRWPWMICEPNEKEGKFLLNEIMQAGNFGKYDQRIIHNSQFIIHNWEKTKHNLRLLTHYPEEVLSEPFFRLYHWIWRRFELWRY